MRKILLCVLFCCSILCFGQRYEIVDSLPLERIMIHFDKEIDDEHLISLGGGDYMAPVPHSDKMIIRVNSNRTKAIVLYNSYCFGRHLEFNVEDNERRIILWYQDNNLYCGYIYDKIYKICKYFETRKEFKRFVNRPLFRHYENTMPKMSRRNRNFNPQHNRRIR